MKNMGAQHSFENKIKPQSSMFFLKKPSLVKHVCSSEYIPGTEHSMKLKISTVCKLISVFSDNVDVLY